MISKYLIAFFLIIIFATACGNRSGHLTESVEINFRRSYATLLYSENHTELPEDTIPVLDFIIPGKDSSILTYLTDLGLVDSNRLNVNRVVSVIKDTVSTKLSNGKSIKYYIQLNSDSDKQIIKIEQENSGDTIQVRKVSIAPKLLYFDTFKNYGRRLIVFDPWYFVNGDMYTLRVFEIK